MLNLPRKRVIVAMLLAGLALAACGGDDDDTGGATDAASATEPVGAESEADVASTDAAAPAASAELLSESLCDVLVGFDTGNGPLELLDTTTAEGSRNCSYFDGTVGLQLSVNVGDVRLDRGVLEEFAESGGATPLDGLGDIAIAQPDFGVRAIWADQALLFVAGYGTETLENGGRAVDLAASEAAAREVAAAIADQLPS
jgi:hypothetical protein